VCALVALVLVLTLGCSDDRVDVTAPAAVPLFSPDSPNDEEFYFHAHAHPLEAGRSWEYQSVYYSTNFEPPELQQTHGFSMNRYSTVWVAGPEVLPNGQEAVKVNEVWQHNETTFESSIWLKNTKSYVKQHGVAGGYAMVQPLKTELPYTYRFAGRDFASLEDLRLFIGNGVAESGRQDDTTWYDPPLNSIKTLPVMGARWEYLDRTEPAPLIIEKEYFSFGQVTEAAGTFDFLGVYWHHDTNGDGEFDDDFWISDRIADIGLVSRRYQMNDIKVMNEFGEVLGTFDMVEHWGLQSYCIPGLSVHR
jgi:hypothetical protein